MTEKYTVINKLTNKVLGVVDNIDDAHDLIFDNLENYDVNESEDEDAIDRFIFDNYEVVSE